MKPLSELLAEALDDPGCLIHDRDVSCYRAHADCYSTAALEVLSDNSQAVLDWLVEQGKLSRYSRLNMWDDTNKRFLHEEDVIYVLKDPESA